jgi:hypothetical protein
MTPTTHPSSDNTDYGGQAGVGAKRVIPKTNPSTWFGTSTLLSIDKLTTGSHIRLKAFV